jgi:hypothetical protein
MVNPPGVWTLFLGAQMCYEKGVTERLMRMKHPPGVAKPADQLEARVTPNHEPRYPVGAKKSDVIV